MISISDYDVLSFIASLGIHFSAGTGLDPYVALLCPNHKVSENSPLIPFLLSFSFS